MYTISGALIDHASFKRNRFFPNSKEELLVISRESLGVRRNLFLKGKLLIAAESVQLEIGLCD